MVARLGFSVAVHLNPDILLIDEILAVGDTHFQARCYERLDDFRRQGTTFVIVSHALAEIRRLCERVVWLARGKILMQGEPDEVIAAYGSRERTRASADLRGVNKQVSTRDRSDMYTYAQNFEDVMLNRLFHEHASGLYRRGRLGPQHALRDQAFLQGRLARR
jgi:ABC-type glutathione transport system ATPase component